MNYPDGDAFARQVRRALRHLYEPVELRLSPLARILGLDRQADVPSELRKILTEAIHALRPGDKVPADSNAWRIYQMLCYRYEEQFSLDEVAAQIAVSPRQARRLEALAIQALIDLLIRKYNINLSAIQGEESMGEQGLVSEPALQAAGGKAPTLNEFDWLKKSYTNEIIRAVDLVESAIQLSQPLLQETGVKIVTDLSPNLPVIAGQATTLRQALLNMFMAAIKRCPLRTLNVQARQISATVQIDLWSADVETFACDIDEFLQVAQRLAELSQGAVYRLPPEAGRAFGLRMSIPVAELISVLVVDDNEDSLRLFQRYLQGTRYRFLGTREADQVISMAERYHPQAILLDIMLPKVDGWELLGRIRAHPRLEAVPVIVLTILPYEQLAASLGATGFLRKPVSREKLLSLLDQLIPQVD